MSISIYSDFVNHYVLPSCSSLYLYENNLAIIENLRKTLKEYTSSPATIYTPSYVNVCKLYSMKRDGVIDENYKLIIAKDKIAKVTASYFQDICLSNRHSNGGWGGSYQEGQFKNGSLHGKGFQQFLSGHVFEGEFKNAFRIGGKLT